jgi:hypothetical protein
MEMASFSLKIRHVFGFTWLTERSIGAGPPVIIQLSGAYAQNVTTHSRASELRKSHLKSQQKLQVKRALTEGNK